jgi:hypothetical protein
MTSELAVTDTPTPGHGLSLLEGPDPATAVAYARRVSAQIAGVLEPGNGYTQIGKNKHINIEGWIALAAMTRHSVHVEWSRPVAAMEADDRGVLSWEAHAYVLDEDGRRVSDGEAMADPSEKNAKGNPVSWRTNNQSVRGMCQTRAQSRALASRLKYIVQLAGFSGTPAEEMGDAPPAPDPLEVARQRFKILTRAENGLAQEQEAVMNRLGGSPERLADDAHFAYIAFMLGAAAEARDATDEALDGEPVEEDAEVPGQESLIPDDHDDVA